MLFIDSYLELLLYSYSPSLFKMVLPLAGEYPKFISLKLRKNQFSTDCDDCFSSSSSAPDLSNFWES